MEVKCNALRCCVVEVKVNQTEKTKGKQYLMCSFYEVLSVFSVLPAVDDHLCGEIEHCTANWYQQQDVF